MKTAMTLPSPRLLSSSQGEPRRMLVVLTAPLLYICLIPMVLLDIAISVYQLICFPAFEIPAVRRCDHFIYDRGRLPYLNLRDRLHCVYCSYANGLCSYVTEISARTEQRWCPIKHAREVANPHSRYALFFNYGNADGYLRDVEFMCRDFRDLMAPNHRRNRAG